METIFLKLLNMSISAGWLVLAVVVLRLLLKAAPKAVRCVLWALVAVRLICPFSVESVLSLIPRAAPVSQEMLTPTAPAVEDGTVIWNTTNSPAATAPAEPQPTARVSPAAIASWVWVAGMAAMLAYTLASYFRLRRRVREAVVWQGNVWLCDRVATPFILGLLHPRIFLPSAISETDHAYVLAHERAHLQRRDHWIKPLGFLLLTVYWFHPLMWVAYILLCRDIELACDERVIRQLGAACKKPYADALINCSVPRRAIAACPLAFGEVGVRARIQSVLHYKKPAFWVVLVAIVSCVAVALCFLTDPKTEQSAEKTPAGVTFVEGGSELPGVSIEVSALDLTGVSPHITITWKNEREDTIIFGEAFYIYREQDGEWVDCRTIENYVVTAIGYILAPGGERAETYSLTYIDMSAPGRYRFVSDCDIDGQGGADAQGNYVDYDVWVEFELTEDIVASGGNAGVTPLETRVLTTVRAPMKYTNGSTFFFDKATFQGETPVLAKACTISKEKLSTLLAMLEGKTWVNDYTADRSGLFFDGKIYQAGWIYFGYESQVAYYDHYFCELTASDIQMIRQFESTATEYAATVDQVLFFAEATAEGEAATVLYRVSVSENEMKALLSMLKKQKWQDDRMLDRMTFSFDGKISYGDGIYFGYEQRVVYYDQYFCELSESDMQRIQELEDVTLFCEAEN